MKFDYEYRTSDNVRQSGMINAADRDAAYATLKAQGIKPSMVRESPGFFNKLFGKGKRWIAIVVLVFIAAGLLAFIFSGKRSEVVEREVEKKLVDVTLDNSQLIYADAQGHAKPIERRQIWGDDAVIAMAAKQNWKVIFPNPADRLLALFAQPGHMLAVMPRIPDTIQEDFKKALDSKFAVEEKDLDEYKQMKCIVEGMKQELRDYLAAGGNLQGYVKRLQLRQKEEADFIEKAKKELAREVEKGGDPYEVWQSINRNMRSQGLPALPMPQ